MDIHFGSSIRHQAKTDDPDRRKRLRARRTLWGLYAGLVAAISIIAMAQYMRITDPRSELVSGDGPASLSGLINVEIPMPADQGRLATRLADVSPAAGKPGPWRQNAARFDGAGARGHLVIVIDDMGHDRARTSRFAALPGPLTFAMLPSTEGVAEQADELRSQGHELLLHLPMESRSGANPGPHALATGQSPGEILRRLQWNLEQFEGYVGVNNHMGSRYTENFELTAAILGELDRRGLLFLDSLTSRQSSAAGIARDMGMPWANRDVFIDIDREPGVIRSQLLRAAEIALRNGVAVAIGHPFDVTYQALQTTLPEIEKMGLRLVPVSAAVRIGKTRVWSEPARFAAGSND